MELHTENQYNQHQMPCKCHGSGSTNQIKSVLKVQSVLRRNIILIAALFYVLIENTLSTMQGFISEDPIPNQYIEKTHRFAV